MDIFFQLVFFQFKELAETLFYVFTNMDILLPLFFGFLGVGYIFFVSNRIGLYLEKNYNNYKKPSKPKKHKILLLFLAFFCFLFSFSAITDMNTVVKNDDILKYSYMKNIYEGKETRTGYELYEYNKVISYQIEAFKNISKAQQQELIEDYNKAFKDEQITNAENKFLINKLEKFYGISFNKYYSDKSFNDNQKLSFELVGLLEKHTPSIEIFYFLDNPNTFRNLAITFILLLLFFFSDIFSIVGRFISNQTAILENKRTFIIDFIKNEKLFLFFISLFTFISTLPIYIIFNLGLGFFGDNLSERTVFKYATPIYFYLNHEKATNENVLELFKKHNLDKKIEVYSENLENDIDRLVYKINKFQTLPEAEINQYISLYKAIIADNRFIFMEKNSLILFFEKHNFDYDK